MILFTVYLLGCWIRMLRTHTHRLGLAIVLSLAPISAVWAGWGDLLKQVEEKAPDLLDSVTGKTSDQLNTNLSSDELIAGLKEALKIGTERAVETVSATNGYLGNPEIRIPLPDKLEAAGNLLRKFGMDSTVDSFEESMNHAAEKAAPEAKAIFLDTLSQMSIEDAKKIYQGDDDAATRYFEDKTRDKLSSSFKPLIKDSMAEVNVTGYYQQLVEQAKQYPLMNKLDLDLENYVTDKALDGLFTMLAAEEMAIREDPAARTTELLKKLFDN